MLRYFSNDGGQRGVILVLDSHTATIELNTKKESRQSESYMREEQMTLITNFL
jgi:hypothetical protein